MAQRTLTDAEDAEFLRLYAAEGGSEELAAKFGLCESGVRVKAHRAEVNSPNCQRPPEAEQALVLGLLAEGELTQVAIGRRVDRSRWAVRRIRDRARVPVLGA